MSYEQILGTAGSGAILLGVGWGILAGLSHAINFRRFATTVASYDVLPAKFVLPYCALAVPGLVGGTLAASFAQPLPALLGGLVLLFTFVSFSIGAWIAARRAYRPLKCGCVGGILSNDLTTYTWVWPGTIALFMSIGITVRQLTSQAWTSDSVLLGSALAIVISLWLLAFLEIMSLLSRRQIWMRQIADKAMSHV